MFSYHPKMSNASAMQAWSDSIRGEDREAVIRFAGYWMLAMDIQSDLGVPVSESAPAILKLLEKAYPVSAERLVSIKTAIRENWAKKADFAKAFPA